MNIVGRQFRVGGQIKTVKKFDASWSLKLSVQPHIIHILWEGGTYYEKYESDNTGDFISLEVV